MIDGLKPYPEYKDSGSRWLGEVPAHWKVQNLRTLITPCSERNQPDLPLLSVAREIQHSAGSGKSNSIAWLAHQFVGLEKESKPVFDSVVIVTDRRILDKQIKDTIKQLAQVGSIVGHAEDSGDLRKFLQGG